MIGALLILFRLSIAAPAPVIAPADPLSRAGAPLPGPPAEYWPGPGSAGRDALSRVLYGARISVPGAVVMVTGARVADTAIGSAEGCFGGRVACRTSPFSPSTW